MEDQYPHHHDETLVRPETDGVPKSINECDAELVFFNTFFCPFAQMVWIAINEKGLQDKTKFIEGLIIRGGEYEVHPQLKELGRSLVPTLYHPASNKIVDQSTPCIEFIDENFGDAKVKLTPESMKEKLQVEACEEIVHGVFTVAFHAMLLHQDVDSQNKDKEDLLWAVEELVETYEGPFYLGEKFSVADIVLAPYFDHMIVLQHYRDFKVPVEGPTAKWHQWSSNVLARPSVAATRQAPDRIIEAYKRYAKCYVRNNMYKRIFHCG